MYERSFCFSTQEPKTDGIEIIKPTYDNDPHMFVDNGGWLIHSEGQRVVEPLIIRTKVPAQGNYEVTLTLTADNVGDCPISIFTNRRHIVAMEFSLEPHQKLTRTFWVHVAPTINVVGGDSICDQHIYLSFFGLTMNTNIEVTLKKSEVPTIHIVGDSIATDDEAYVPYAPQHTWSGWGQHLGQWLSGVAVNNQAHNGMTTICFRDDGHWQLILDELKPKDIVMFHFGHNDQKRTYLNATGGYTTNIRRYIKEVKARAAFPILVTSLSRIPVEDKQHKLFDTLTDYALALQRIGEETETAVIDLHNSSFNKLCQLKEEINLSGYFMDAAHTNDFGAELVTKQLVHLIRQENIIPLINFVKTRKFEELNVDIDKQTVVLDNEQPITKVTRPTIHYRDAQFLSDEVKKMLYIAIQRHVIDPCVLYLHPNDSMSRGQFLYAFSQVAQPFSRSAYAGKYIDISPHEWFAPYVQAAEMANLVDSATVTQDEFRLADDITGQELISMVVRNMRPVTKRDIDLHECAEIAARHGLLWSNYKSNKSVSRLNCYLTIIHMLIIMENNLKQNKGVRTNDK